MSVLNVVMPRPGANSLECAQAAHPEDISMSNGPKTVPVDPYKRSPPSPAPPDRHYPKPGPKTVPVEPHKRSPPSPPATPKKK
jgi:hypothetical protein